MAKHIRCGHLFDGVADDAKTDQTVVVDGGTIKYVGDSAKAPKPGSRDEVVDASKYFVMPGMTDLHTHLSYGNAMCEEDIDIYASVELRALRGVINAQRVLMAGVTSMGDPGGSARVQTSVRNAINAGMFPGPRINCSGPYVTSRQGLTDYYPTWFGAPSTSIGALVKNMDEAIELIRTQVKDGVDFVKFAMDGRHVNDKGELIAAFSLAETKRMVDECHRLGKKTVMHARGREATLYCAKAGADLIFHASWADAECIDAIVKHESIVCPTLTLLYQNMTVTQPTDPLYHKVRPDLGSKEWEAAIVSLNRIREAGIPMVTGSEAGFALTPYGEWHWREVEIFHKFLGFTPAEAIRCATSASAAFLNDGGRLGVLKAGKHADFIVFDGNPLKNVSLLLEKARLKDVYLAGEPVRLELPPIASKGISDFSYKMWQDMYTQERVKQLGNKIRHIQAAE